MNKKQIINTITKGLGLTTLCFVAISCSSDETLTLMVDYVSIYT